MAIWTQDEQSKFRNVFDFFISDIREKIVYPHLQAVHYYL